MAGFACPHCGHTTAIFGEGGGQKLAREFDVPVLGSIPIDTETRVGGDTGEPIVVARPSSPQAEAFRRVAAGVRDRLLEAAAPKLPLIR
jgi:ATP-binding protein involved in chromosome partitioning